MNDDRAAVLHVQKSLTEWLEDIRHKDAGLIREQDNAKRERLQILHDRIGLPFDKPTQFAATELHPKSTAFKAYLARHGKELCGLRLIPLRPGLPKLRTRGVSISQAYDWFMEQSIEPADYRADFTPDSAVTYWSTIFVINRYGIYGEIIAGGAYQLTSGMHSDTPPIVFAFKGFKEWELSVPNAKARAHLEELVAYLHVPSLTVQKKLRKQLGASFRQMYLTGYFETADTPLGTWFIDYNQYLGKRYADLRLRVTPLRNAAIVTGQTGCPGIVRGTVRIVLPDAIAAHLEPGTILVCPITTPAYVPLLRNAAAVVTDRGGILSHAAIITRELGIPCIVGSGNATTVLRNGQIVTVDAGAGAVYD